MVLPVCDRVVSQLTCFCWSLLLLLLLLLLLRFLRWPAMIVRGVEIGHSFFFLLHTVYLSTWLVSIFVGQKIMLVRSVDKFGTTVPGISLIGTRGLQRSTRIFMYAFIQYFQAAHVISPCHRLRCGFSYTCIYIPGMQYGLFAKNFTRTACLCPCPEISRWLDGP